MNTYIWPYKKYSESARALSFKTGFKIIGDDYNPLRNDVVINWGNSRNPSWHNRSKEELVAVINPPEKVRIAVNKISTLSLLSSQGVMVPGFTTDINEAISWKCPIILRKTVTSKGGDGIIYLGKDDISDEEVIKHNPKLITKYVKKSSEYRVSIFKIDGIYKLFDISEKRRKIGLQNCNYIVRNHKSGWTYCRENIDEKNALVNSAISAAYRAIMALELDFGSVDVIVNKLYNRAYVLEVNTAPGFTKESTTCTRFASALNETLIQFMV